MGYIYLFLFLYIYIFRGVILNTNPFHDLVGTQAHKQLCGTTVTWRQVPLGTPRVRIPSGVPVVRICDLSLYNDIFNNL